MTVILRPQRDWYCPNCPLEQTTFEARPHTRYHVCPGLHNLSAPMIAVGARVKVEAVERGDYIGNEIAGRFMAVRTERPDGSNDVAVMAPTAHLRVVE